MSGAEKHAAARWAETCGTAAPSRVWAGPGVMRGAGMAGPGECFRRFRRWGGLLTHWQIRVTASVTDSNAPTEMKIKTRMSLTFVARDPDGATAVEDVQGVRVSSGSHTGNLKDRRRNRHAGIDAEGALGVGTARAGGRGGFPKVDSLRTVAPPPPLWAEAHGITRAGAALGARKVDHSPLRVQSAIYSTKVTPTAATTAAAAAIVIGPV